MECEQFWLESPVALFDSLDIVPEKSMCINSKLNAATRLAILISIVLYVAKIKEWRLFLGGALIFIVLVFFACRGSKEGFRAIQTLNPVWYHDQTTPIESIDSMCNQDYEMIDDNYTNDVEYIDTEYRPKLYFGHSNLMPDEEDQYEGLDRVQLQRLNTEKFANRTIEARESMVQIFKKELEERFEPDEYYESY